MNKYCVYIHRRADNDVVFYVGHGTLERSKSGSLNKTQRWQTIENEAGGHRVEILYGELSKEEAINKEQELLLSPPESWNLVNVHRITAKTKDIDIDFISSVVKYDENSVTGLVWATNRGTSIKAKESAGYVVNGYYRVEIAGQSYSNHRIIYSLFNGVIDKNLTINHIDNNPLNNKIDNLELVSQSDNNRRKNKTSSVSTGVYWYTEKRNGTVKTYALAQYNLPCGKQRKKLFSVSRGLLEAWYQACQFRLQMVKQYY